MSYPSIRLSTVLAFIILAIPLCSFGQLPKEARMLRTVVIDPGHGGNDPGTVVAGVKEKDVVLSIALRLGNKIKYEFPDVKVIFTRSKDIFIPLYERASVANRNKADLFISVHANYFSKPSIFGTETFTLGLHRSQENLEVAKKENSVILLEDDYKTNYQGFDPRETESYIMFDNMHSEYQLQSIELAASIQDEFSKNLKWKHRGVKQAGLLVLRETSMPAVLVETGFISNPSEREFLVSESGKEKISESIYKAFSEYKKMIDLKSRFDITSQGQTAVSNEVTATYSESSDPQAKNGSDSISSLTTDPAFQPAKTEITPDSSIKIATVYEKNNQTSGNTLSNHEIRIETNNNVIFYSVQVGAFNTAIEPSADHFKGEKNIFRVKVAPYNKYFSGRFKTPEDAFKEKSRLKNNYPDAFVVVFENNVPRIYRNR
jgi:N-acetylmuramoyl-L-alanine amidase